MASNHSNLSKPPRIVSCPRCRTPVEWVEASRFRPFCSARCKTDDLGAWESEAYRVAASEEAPLSDESG
ncbi:MAG: DNA gyrase inhibitor YacG [Rugosibacter sp.]|nr:MAG: DNA gyrase inhibitor YacG [Rugosibacter sp.]TBR10298.1 MAG: DNA gyrase inhibitor YacG [Rugosibacter sp.]